MTIIALCGALVLAADADPRQSVIVVVGAEGAEEYGQQFTVWADRWVAAADRSGSAYVSIGRDGESGHDDRTRLRNCLSGELHASSDTLWLVLIGHGTFDGHHAKFNLRGPDVTDAELVEWLKPCSRPLAIINCASASGPFINSLSGPNRILVTATKSGFEYSFARFGDYLSKVITDPAADLDKDEQTSLLEAFLMASAQVDEFYAQEARLASEHALIDDNGDGLGTPASWFRGVRAIRSAKDGAPLDGLRANQFHLARNPSEQKMPLEMRTRRDQLELEIARLRQSKEKLPEDKYYASLETILVELAQLYEELGKPKEGGENDSDAPPVQSTTDHR